MIPVAATRPSLRLDSGGPLRAVGRLSHGGAMPRLGRSDRRELRAVLVFLALALPFGALLALATPPHDAPDEPRHLQRVWLTSVGRLAVPPSQAGQGGEMPTSLLELHPRYTKGTSGCRHDPAEVRASIGIPLQPERASDAIRTPILYGPVGYLPQAGGVAVGRALGVGAGGLFYLSRIANLLTWSLLCALAIAVAPTRRAVLAAAALLPMSLFEASTVSADASTNGLGLLLLGLVLRLAATGRGPVQTWEKLGVALVTLLLGLGKPGYSGLALIVLAIPAARFAPAADPADAAALGEGARARWSFVGSVLGLAVVVPAAWWAVVQLGGPYPYPNADPPAQLEGLLRAPWRAFGLVAATAVERPLDHVRGVIGVLGRLDVGLPTLVYVGFGAILLAASLGVPRADRPDCPARPASSISQARVERLERSTRYALGWCAVFGAAAIVLLLYVSATPVGASRAVGIQGRYFLPFVPLALCALPTRLELAPRVVGALVAGQLAGWVATIAVVWQRYYAS